MLYTKICEMISDMFGHDCMGKILVVLYFLLMFLIAMTHLYF
jgi:hypothetical protein